jgi:hypothetical protein
MIKAGSQAFICLAWLTQLGSLARLHHLKVGRHSEVNLA